MPPDVNRPVLVFSISLCYNRYVVYLVDYAVKDAGIRNGVGMKMNRLTKILICLAVLLLLLLGASALAEPAVTFSPENPKMGEYVDVTVTPGRDGMS